MGSVFDSVWSNVRFERYLRHLHPLRVSVQIPCQVYISHNVHKHVYLLVDKMASVLLAVVLTMRRVGATG
eukprot:11217192-Lingulodinium_polyedra.AAC.1